MHRTFLSGLPVLLVLGVFPQAVLSADAVDPVLDSRAQELVPFLRGEAEVSSLFAPTFLAQVPVAQLDAITTQLRQQYGAPRAVERINAQSPNAGVVFVDFEKAVVQLKLIVDPEEPHRILGLLVSGVDMKNDNFATLIEEFRSLPGEAHLAVAQLGKADSTLVANYHADQPLAIGSAFKLYILAELSRAITAGEHEWNEVVALERHSLPSGILHAWPEDSPLTLHTLAALMISQSDNTASDTLLRALGRGNVETMMARLSDTAERNRPFLSTLEAFTLKTASTETVAAWREGDESERRVMLDPQLSQVAPSDIDPSLLGGAPRHIDLVEWFASAQDLVQLMDWLRREGDETSRALLAINPGIRPTSEKIAYLGFKGGSEAGVMNLTFLARTTEDKWYSVAGTWNNPDAFVDETRFIALMNRVVDLLP